MLKHNATLYTVSIVLQQGGLIITGAKMETANKVRDNRELGLLMVSHQRAGQGRGRGALPAWNSRQWIITLLRCDTRVA